LIPIVCEDVEAIPFLLSSVRSDDGDVVPIPTFPPLSTIKLVAVDEPITNDGTPDARAFGFIESIPKGVDDAMPNHPELVNVDVAVSPNHAWLAENPVEEAFPLNCCNAVQIFALAKFNPMVLAVPPLYEPENVSEELVAVRSARFPPRAIPEMVELVNPALFRVPDTVGVSVRAPADGTTVVPRVRPLNDAVEVENAIAVLVVVAYPEPRFVRYVPLG